MPIILCLSLASRPACFSHSIPRSMGRTSSCSSSQSILIYVLLWSGKNAAAEAAKFFLQDLQHVERGRTHHAAAAAPPVKVEDTSQRNLPVISVVVGVISAIIAVFLLALAAMGYFQSRCEDKAQTRPCPAGASGNHGGGRQAQKYTLRELQAATVSFTQKLGREGCAGAVFKGILSNSREAAVKLVNDYTAAEFEHEVRRVCALKHENLIRILGYCTDGHHCLLVQEFYPNGSLRGILYTPPSNSTSTSSSNRAILSWRTRFGIALGTARAVAFVHGSCSAGMNVHGRIKPENVLLTESLSPRLADFGFVRWRRKRDHDLTLATAQGTLEYFAPEWWSDPSPMCDVYSFGILLLEIVGGRRISEFYDRPQWEFPDLDDNDGHEEVEDEEEGGGAMARSCCSGGVELLDPELKGKVDMAQLRIGLRVAYWCIQQEARARPSMSQVVEYLEGRVRVPSPPTPSSSAIFTPLHLSYSASLEAFGFRAGNGVEIVKAR